MLFFSEKDIADKVLKNAQIIKKNQSLLFALFVSSLTIFDNNLKQGFINHCLFKALLDL
jgi:hypothetical protein